MRDRRSKYRSPPRRSRSTVAWRLLRSSTVHDNAIAAGAQATTNGPLPTALPWLHSAGSSCRGIPMRAIQIAAVAVFAGLAFPLQAAVDSAPRSRPSFAEPAISPDGSRIAFVSGGAIWEVPSAGGAAHLMVADKGADSRPLFSPV